MRLIQRLQIETEAFHADADEEALQLLGAARPADYLRFLTRTLGFVQPLERPVEAVERVGRESAWCGVFATSGRPAAVGVKS